MLTESIRRDSIRCRISIFSSIVGSKTEGFCNPRSEEHTSELQSQSNLVCRLLLEKKKTHTSSQSTSTYVEGGAGHSSRGSFAAAELVQITVYRCDEVLRWLVCISLLSIGFTPGD